MEISLTAGRGDGMTVLRSKPKETGEGNPPLSLVDSVAVRLAVCRFPIWFGTQVYQHHDSVYILLDRQARESSP